MRVVACVLRVFQQESVDGLNAEALLEELGYDGAEEEILSAMFELRDNVEGLDLKRSELLDEDDDRVVPCRVERQDAEGIGRCTDR
jgi:hypothetical protein